MGRRRAPRPAENAISFFQGKGSGLSGGHGCSTAFKHAMNPYGAFSFHGWLFCNKIGSKPYPTGLLPFYAGLQGFEP